LPDKLVVTIFTPSEPRGVDVRSGERAEQPVTRVDFVNSVDRNTVVTLSPQPGNHDLARLGAFEVDDTLVVNSRVLVDAVLKEPDVFSSADLVEQGNIRPLIPLAIDPPDHAKYRRLLDPLFAPRRVEVLEDDIARRVNRLIDSFVDRGACNFTDEFAELLPSSVFLGLMGLPFEELPGLIRLRDGLLRPGDAETTPEERSEIQRRTAREVYE
jgi:cytochrome P450